MIGLPAKQVVIEGETYTIRLLDAYAGSALYAKLLSAAGGALSALGSVDTKGVVKSDLAGELGIAAAGALLRGISPELFKEVRDTFAASCCVTKDGKEPELKNIFAFHFAGRYAHMSKWLLECMKVNFADFLDGDLAGQIIAKFKPSSESKSPLDSTGSSTES